MALRSNFPALSLAALLALSPATAFAQTKFAVMGDFGDGPASDSVATLIKSNNPSLILTVGDNCYDSVPLATQVDSKYGEYVRQNRFWPSLGNHDYSDPCGGGTARAYFAYFTLPNNERYYDFVVGPVHFFALNSNGAREPDGDSAKSKQARWLKRKIAASTAPWQVVYFHHTAYSSGEHGGTPRMRWPFEDWGADLVLAGHDHDYERIERDDNKDGKKLTYIVAGTGGQPLRPFSTPIPGSIVRYDARNGALFVTATDSSLQLEFRDIGGSVPDTVTISK